MDYAINAECRENFLWLTSFSKTGLVVLLAMAGNASITAAEDQTTPQFADATKARYISGELVYIDPVNRRGGIRLDGDQGRYHTGPPHWFALLPYAPVWHNGAQAELRDLPLGTHVHGYFVVPPAGEEGTIPPLTDEKKLFSIPENHALMIEDDFSFYQRRGQVWQVASIDINKEKISLEPLAIVPPVTTLLLGAGGAGQLVKDGINEFGELVYSRSRLLTIRQLVGYRFDAGLMGLEAFQ